MPVGEEGLALQAEGEQVRHRPAPSHLIDLAPELRSLSAAAQGGARTRILGCVVLGRRSL